jgi:16S rRNA (cytosine1402-N4)-methyltransferase
MHTPVLLDTVLAALSVKPAGLYVDATLGEGGHTSAILNAGGTVLAIDRDSVQIDKQKKALHSPNLTLALGNFADIEQIAQKNGFSRVDGVLFDLGLSFAQLKEGGKGLSFKNDDEPLDMRLDEEADRTASRILKQYSHEALVRVFMENAEEIQAEQIVTVIEERRKNRRELTVGWLRDCVHAAKVSDPNRSVLRVFQALRIEVNDEFNNLQKGLQGATRILKPDGVLAVISFHSLEDRIVKRFIRTNGYTQTTKKPVKGDEQIRFERSAMLRVFHI